MKTESMKWINSAGGPLVLIPRSALIRWRGAADGHGVGTDYDAACAVSSYAGVIHRHGVDILILNDEPLQTTAVATEDAVFLVRWMYAPNESAVLASLRDIRGRLGPPCERASLASVECEYVLLDAASTGSSAGDRLDVVFGFCPERVETHVWKPETDVGLLVHVLKSSTSSTQRP
jgi:hypothetical protein